MKTYREFCNAEGLQVHHDDSSKKYYRYLIMYYSGLALQGYMSTYADTTRDPSVDHVVDMSIRYASGLAAKMVLMRFPGDKTIFSQD
jgi:hypothetical protein